MAGVGAITFGNFRQRFWQRLRSKHTYSEVAMQRHFRGPFWLALFFALFSWRSLRPEAAAAAGVSANDSPGSLEIVGKDGSVTGICPLKHTSVRGAISGFIARVNVTQVFENSATQPIEAVYVFPLPQDAAVDDMTIQVGERTIRSLIKKRDEARAIYEKAKQTGRVAALLDQERPNIFTQSVANIMPGEQVTVTISYLQTLQYEDGSYEFVFPMVVGPRYIPGDAAGKQAGGWAPDTDKVPDASRITPIVAKNTRAGHDISLELAIDAGVPIQELRSTLHEIDVDRTGAATATVKLRNQAEIPNKDFVLKYDVAGAQVSDAVLSQAMAKDSKLGPGGYFTLILQPPARFPESDVTPKELVFVLDTSGSMWGFPLDKGKELVTRALDELYPGDTFNLITFSGDTEVLFPEPVYPTAQNLAIAKRFLASRSGGGGTEMMKAIRAALEPSDAQDHVRVVCFVTDGYVGNDMEIIGEVQKHPNARVFSFGIGNSVNRFLLEGMAKAGRGDAEIVTLSDKANQAAHRLYERLRSPLLTDLTIDWGGLPVADVNPQRLPDLFSGKPLVVTGRYTAAATGKIQLKGKRAGEDFVREIPVSLAAEAGRDNMLPSFWARRKIDDLMSQDWAGMQRQSVKPEIEKEITQLGLDYRLMTQFTSFVAVEDRVVNTNGVPQTIQVPVEMPEGVSYDKVFGEGDMKQMGVMGMSASIPTASRSYSTLAMPKTSAGFGAGISGGAFTGGPMSVAPPPPRVSSSEPVASVKPKGERGMMESKLHPDLLKAFDCWKKGGECKSVMDEKIQVQIFLAARSEALAERLKALGFEAIPSRLAPKFLVGRVPVKNLPALAQMAEVRFVSPVGSET